MATAAKKTAEISQMIPLTPSQIADTIRNHMEMQRMFGHSLTPMIWGPPGIGKSQVIAQVVESLGYELIDVRLTNFDAVDVRGIPYNTETGVRWSVPAVFPRSNAKIVILFDELAQATADVQKAIFQLLTDRRIGDYILPADVVMLAGGNRLEDRSGSAQMLDATKSRLRHFEMRVDVDEWLDHGFRVGYHPMLLAYIKSNPSELLIRDDKERYGSRSPRTWGDGINKVLFLNDKVPMTPHMFQAEVVANIGTGGGNVFVEWTQIRFKLPDLEDIRRNGDKAKGLDKTDPDYASVSMVTGMNIISIMKAGNDKVKAARGTAAEAALEAENYELQQNFFLWMKENIRKALLNYIIKQFVDNMKQVVKPKYVPAASTVLRDIARDTAAIRE